MEKLAKVLQDLGATGALERLPKKKRPTPEGAGLPGVVSSNIVNWEGNYILDTNTFIIVPVPPKTLILSYC